MSLRVTTGEGIGPVGDFFQVVSMLKMPCIILFFMVLLYYQASHVGKAYLSVLNSLQLLFAGTLNHEA